ncbi:hypothetical protein J6590_001932 [Homalodisca vitripennis]|nr:hypothetical protein J6590_001932 [Homalodisca vitripennis]
MYTLRDECLLQKVNSKGRRLADGGNRAGATAREFSGRKLILLKKPERSDSHKSYFACPLPTPLFQGSRIQCRNGNVRATSANSSAERQEDAMDSVVLMGLDQDSIGTSDYARYHARQRPARPGFGLVMSPTREHGVGPPTL